MKQVFSILLIIFSVNIFPQSIDSTQKVNNIVVTDINAMGQIGISYEKCIIKLKRVSYFAHLGCKSSFDAPYSLGLELGLRGFTGKRKSHFEFGYQYCNFELKNNYSSRNHILSLKQVLVGYRFQNFYKKGIMFNIGLAGTFFKVWDDDYATTDFLPLPYVGVGYCF